MTVKSHTGKNRSSAEFVGCVVLIVVCTMETLALTDIGM